MNHGQLRKIAEASDLYNCSFVRLTQGQDIILPLVQRASLPELYKFLTTELADIDLTLRSFDGHITSCVGVNVCKIGILDSPALGKAVAAKLDEAGFSPENYAEILDMIKISGCPNCCAGHPAACIGMQGQKKRINDKLENVYKIFTRTDAAFALAVSNDDLIKQDDVPDKVVELLKQKFKDSSSLTMKISTRTRYGLRLLVYLAGENPGKLIQVKEVAKHEDIPAKYLEQIIRPLKKAGMLKVVRGAKGGYFIGRRPEDISVKEVFDVLENNSSLLDCLQKRKSPVSTGIPVQLLISGIILTASSTIILKASASLIL